MLLKSIEIQGFKSFADKTVLEFGNGVTAVVGPNGSGKSNISDAVRWVLGEQSTRNLRGQAMEDVIFSGTNARRPHGFAEVTLVIDNKDRSLNFDNDTVAVTRRYYRSHESEYLINKAVVRLKDVHELFMDTGLGRDGYSMIGQGKIDNIVSSRSNERRDIFEEASGISRYRYRKSEAERKLAQADENLIRLKDIMKELEDRVGPLAEQSEKAHKFLEFAAQKKKLEIGLWLNSLERSNDNLREQEHKITLASAQYEDAEKRIAEIVENIEKNSENYTKTISLIDEQRRIIASAEEDITRTEGEINVFLNTIKYHNESIERLLGEIEELKKSDDSAVAEIEEKNQLKLKKRDEIVLLKEQYNEAKDQLTNLISNSESITRKMEELTLKVNAFAAEMSDTRVKMVTAESSVAEIDSRQTAIEETLVSKNTELENFEKEYLELKAFLGDAEDKITSSQNALNGYELRFNSKQSKVDELKEKIDSAHLNLEEKKRRIFILEDLERNLEGFNNAVKSVMSDAEDGLITGVHGPVSRIINVDKEYAVAIETALGNKIQNIVVDDDSVAKKAIKMLKTQNKGRATFLPISSIKGRVFDEKPADDCYGYIGIASELVNTDKQYREIINSLLGRILIVEDIDAAVKIAKKYNYRFNVVSLDGQVVNSGGSLTGGSLVKNAGVLSRANEIEKLKSQVDNMLVKNKLLDEQYEAAKSELSVAEAEIVNAKSVLATANEDKIRITVELKRVEELKRNAESVVRSIISEQELNIQRKDELKTVIEQSLKAVSEIDAKKQELQSEIDKMAGGREDVSLHREQLTEKITSLKLSIIECEKDEQALNETIVLLQSSISDRTEKIAQTEKSIAEFKINIEQTNAAIEELKLRISEKREQILKTNDLIKDLSSAKDNADVESQELRKNERELMGKKETLGGELARLTERKEAMVREFDEIVKKLFDEYELTRSEAEKISEKIMNVSEAKKLLAEVKSKIRSLGHVNVSAIEEYKEVSERYEFMKGQMDDIEQSRSQLQKLINELTEQMKVQFKEGFDKINQNFVKTFTDLFGGGTAELVLSEPDNILESGIDISVRLPGKNVPSLDGLSGGEKALIAIAIYFAIMKVNPPPFCFLDEVDTALDDINVDRFADYMAKSDFATQFICVTHRRGTMEAADMLYGVTMQEKGVTKLLQLNVDELVKKLNLAENK